MKIPWTSWKFDIFISRSRSRKDFDFSPFTAIQTARSNNYSALLHARKLDSVISLFQLWTILGSKNSALLNVHLTSVNILYQYCHALLILWHVGQVCIIKQSQCLSSETSSWIHEHKFINAATFH